MKINKIGYVVSVTSLLVLMYCTSFGPYRAGESKEECNVKSLDQIGVRPVCTMQPEDGIEYKLGFAEFDDQGQFHSQKQIDAVYDSFQKEVNVKGKDVVLVVFAHGWKNNAKPGNENLKKFNELLKFLVMREKARPENKKREILGLYLGWRGSSLPIPYLDFVTFWDRKSTAEKVGTHGVITILSKFENLMSQKKREQGSNSWMVTIGHSFGGAIVYRSIQQIMLSRFVEDESDQQIRGFGDLVLLLNPAFEALQHLPLYGLALNKCNYKADQRPRLVVLTSESDRATQLAFPIGRSLSTFFEYHKADIERKNCSTGQDEKISEGKADRHTIGHFPKFITHDLTLIEMSDEMSKETIAPSVKDKDADIINYNQHQRISDIWNSTSSDKSGIYLILTGKKVMQLKRNKVPKRLPYLNIKVQSKIMDGHNDIWRSEIFEFVNNMLVANDPRFAQKK
jgi:hypothetical protein